MTQQQGRRPLVEEPTDREKAEIAVLAEVDENDFTRDLIRYLARPDESGRRVFRSRDLAVRTQDALRRIVGDTKRRLKTAQGRERAAADQMRVLAAAELKVVTPIVKLIAMESADMGPRRQCERLLGEVHLDQLRFLMSCKAEGMSGAQAVAALKDALDADERLGARARANDLLGKLLGEERDHLIELLGQGVGRDEALKAVKTMLARRFGGPADER
jgi:hypothetical protein